MTDKQEQYQTPACFESAEQWREYQKLWRLSKGTGRIHYCCDCLPEYRDAMIEQGRCAFPQTVFVQQQGEIVGLNGLIWSAWASAISGRGGELVSPPDPVARDRFIAETYAGSKSTRKYFQSCFENEQPDPADA